MCLTLLLIGPLQSLSLSRCDPVGSFPAVLSLPANAFLVFSASNNHLESHQPFTAGELCDAKECSLICIRSHTRCAEPRHSQAPCSSSLLRIALMFCAMYIAAEHESNAQHRCQGVYDRSESLIYGACNVFLQHLCCADDTQGAALEHVDILRDSHPAVPLNDPYGFTFLLLLPHQVMSSILIVPLSTGRQTWVARMCRLPFRSATSLPFLMVTYRMPPFSMLTMGESTGCPTSSARLSADAPASAACSCSAPVHTEISTAGTADNVALAPA